MIAFDLQAVQSIGNSERGIARFVTEIVRHMIAGPHSDRVDLFLWNDRLPRSERLDAFGLGDRLRSFSEVAGRHVDVLHVNSPFELPGLVDQLPPVRPQRLVTTCYDLIPYLFPENYLASRYASAAYRRRLGLIATSDAVVTDSRSAADDVVEHLGVDPDRVTVLGAGVSPQFRPPDAPLTDRIAALRAEWPGLSARYVLVPTAADWRKNSVGAIEAFAGLPRDVRERHQLVLFCRLTDGQRSDLEGVAAVNGVAAHVFFTGFVPDDLLIALYQSAELVMFPTYYEGFGLPVIEARRCGARVICSNTSSLPEVLVDVQARFNPFDRADVTATLLRALTDAPTIAMLERVPDAGFSWDLAVVRLVGVYDGLRDSIGVKASVGTVGTVGVEGVRVAIAGSLSDVRHVDGGDGERGVVRDLVTRLLAAGDHLRPTVYSVPHRPGVLVDDRCQVRPFAELALAWESGDVDAIVYVLGERSNGAVRAAMEVMPGHVVTASDRHPPRFERSLSRHDVDDADLVDRLAEAIAVSCRAERAGAT